MHKIKIWQKNESGSAFTGYSAMVKDEFDALNALRIAQSQFGIGTLQAITEDDRVAASITVEVNEVFPRG